MAYIEFIYKLLTRRGCIVSNRKYSIRLCVFCNSGAEANEAALKLARKHTGKSLVVTCEQSFHGRTFGTMSATGQDKVKEGFGPLLPSFYISLLTIYKH